MKKKLIVFFSLTLLGCLWVANKSIGLFLAASSAYVDFDDSMQMKKYAYIKHHDYEYDILNFLRKLYNANIRDHCNQLDQIKIPKIIYHIWLGSKFPAEYISYRRSWMDHHPGWDFVFLTDNPVNYDQGLVVLHSFEELGQWLQNNSKNEHACVVDTKGLVFDNRRFYDASNNYGEKSDILRWELVYRFGGLYVDTDFECLKPLDCFHMIYDFYVGVQPLDVGLVQLGAGLFGAHPNHPILLECVEGIKNNQHCKDIIYRTGPAHFTRAVMRKGYVDNKSNIVLPAGYFYPCGFNQKGTHRSVWERPESYAVHHWAGSWLKPEGFEK